jgi:hypothetical protein
MRKLLRSWFASSIETWFLAITVILTAQEAGIAV